MKMGRVTQAKIAERAGVSQATVSMVLSGKTSSSILPETYERVQAAARDLGYRDHTPRQKKPSFNIGYLIPEVRTNDAYDVFIRRFYAGIYEEAQCHKAHVIQTIARTNEPLPDVVREGAVDGVIVEDESEPELIERIAQHVPVVLLNHYHERLEIDASLSDNVGGLCKAMRYLYDLGHRRFAMFGFNPQQTQFVERFQGYKRGLELLGIPYRAEYVALHTPPAPFDMSEADDFSLHTLRGWMALPERPTAVLSFCDNTVSFLLRAARALDIAVPAQLSIVGYDSLTLCDHVEPRLTSLREPLEEMGRHAVRLLLERITGVQRSALRYACATCGWICASRPARHPPPRMH
jgi:LacI family transcriptional regulator